MPHRWGILVGINFNENPANRLSGCVRDVSNIKACLEALDGPLDIFTLTASNSPDLDSPCPSEPEERWPTYENLTSTIEQVTNSAHEGDFVYIHFSGHGRRLPPVADSPRGHQNGQFALVLVGDAKGRAFIEGSDLTNRLKRMITKGLKLTLVLDCCFSGSSSRQSATDGTMIRTISRESPQSARASSFLSGRLREKNPGVLRDAEFVPEWLLNPDGYGILTACGPHEIAKELKYNGERNGAFSLFLCQALHSLHMAGVEASHKALYQQICVQFHSLYPQQHPMLYGNPQHMFFGGHGVKSSESMIPVFRPQRSGTIYLTIGYAHGVEIGDEYSLFPVNVAESSQPGYSAPRAQVVAVHGITAELGPADSNDVLESIRTGWMATRCAWQSIPKLKVRLPATVSSTEQWITESARRDSIVVLYQQPEEENTAFFCINSNEERGYHITDHQNKAQNGLPSIGGNGAQAINAVFDLLEHIAAFKFVEGVKNRQPDCDFERSFDLSLFNEMGEDCSENGVVTIKDSEILTFVVRNLTSKPLYVAVLDLCPSWNIVSLVRNDGGGDYIPILPANEDSEGVETRLFRMVLPSWAKDQGVAQCEDVIKFFITDVPASFNALLLPKPSVCSDTSGQQHRGISTMKRDMRLLMGSSLRSPVHEEGNWSTRNFIVITKAIK